jgi:ATP-dependent exoDNAse (exonuclease V) beta subunit
LNDHSHHPFIIYRSSAGSGKTYQLALEFISLVLKDPNLYNKVLAVTFTNKATREMKERILDFLNKLANRQDAELQKNIQEITKLTEDEIAHNASLVINKILHNYSQFSVSTIDAFFQKIVKSFAKELGLLGNFKVELDQERVLQEIIDQIIDDLGTEEDLRSWLVDFSFSKVDEQKAWNIRPEIESLAGEIFKESFRAVESALEKPDSSTFDTLLKTVRQTRRTFENYMTDRAKAALKHIADYGLSINDFAYGISGVAGYFSRIVNNKDFDPKVRARSALDDTAKWSSKSSPRRAEIIRLAESHLREILVELLEYYDAKYSEYITAVEIQRNLHVFGILSRITRKLRAYRQEHDVMLISDVATFLNKIIADNEAPFIYEKTGSWYQHYQIHVDFFESQRQ